MTGQTKNQNGQWWQEVLQSLPEVLGGNCWRNRIGHRSDDLCSKNKKSIRWQE